MGEGERTKHVHAYVSSTNPVEGLIHKGLGGMRVVGLVIGDVYERLGHQFAVA